MQKVRFVQPSPQGAAAADAQFLGGAALVAAHCVDGESQAFGLLAGGETGEQAQAHLGFTFRQVQAGLAQSFVEALHQVVRRCCLGGATGRARGVEVLLQDGEQQRRQGPQPAPLGRSEALR